MVRKKQFTIPRVFLTGAELNDIGGNSGIGGGGDDNERVVPIPCRYEEWLESRWIGEYDDVPGVDFNDYTKWWLVNGFGQEAWASYNPSVAWNEEWSF